MEVEFISMVDPKLGKSIIRVYSILVLVYVAVLVHRLSEVGVLYKAFSRIGRKCISEHIRDNVKVLQDNIRRTPMIEVSKFTSFSRSLQGGFLYRNVEEKTTQPSF